MNDLIDVRELQLKRRVWAAVSPCKVYELISDVSAMAAWSPDLVSAQYDDGDGPCVGSWFTGLNRDENHDHPWQTRMRVTEAEPATAFAWTVVAGDADATRWRYSFRARDGGTLITESWQVLRLFPVMGTSRQALLELRAHNAISMATTLNALAGLFDSRPQNPATPEPTASSIYDCRLHRPVTHRSTQGGETVV